MKEDETKNSKANNKMQKETKIEQSILYFIQHVLETDCCTVLNKNNNKQNI